MNDVAHRPAHVRGLFLLLVVLVVVALGAAVILLVLRHHDTHEETERRAKVIDEGTPVLVAQAEPRPRVQEVYLPGDVRGFNQVTLYAKIAGYLKDIQVDKGDRVTANQVLGQLESPETDQEVMAAEADLVNKRRAAERARQLVSTGVVSAQDLDNANAALEVSQANRKRAHALQEYETLRAPFDGTITARYVDPGALVQGTSPVVDVTELRRLRISVYVGDDAAPYVKVGTPATVVEDARPDKVRHAQVSRIAQALDPRSRTMLCEVWLDNPDEDLYPGTFVHATLHVESPPLPTVPADAIFTRGGNTEVAVVQGDRRLKFVTVQPGLTDGKTVQVKSGLTGNETVAVSVPSQLGEGAVVKPMEMKPQQSPAR